MSRHTGPRALDRITALQRDHLIAPAGTEVIGPGARPGRCLLLHEGWAIRTLRLADGSRQILDVLLPGDIVGLANALLGGQTYAVASLTQARFRRLDGPLLAEMAAAQPDFALALLRTALKEAARTDLRLAMLGQMSAAQRVGLLVLDLFERLRQRGMTRGSTCLCPLRRNDVADAVGLSRVHVLRALGQLRAQTRVELGGGTLTVPDRARLRDFLGLPPGTAPHAPPSRPPSRPRWRVPGWLLAR